MSDAAVDPRYPIGRFKRVASLDEAQRGDLIDAIRQFPEELELVLRTLPGEALDRPYREGGWTIRQLVHHVADSHMNAYIRFRLALTEDHPTIRPYDQGGWANLPDASQDPLTPSLRILEGVHARWSSLLRSTPAESFSRTLHHPESGDMTLDTLLQLYAWHGRHHLEHIRRAEVVPSP
jgi:uncharacterized damage-inducible protein DinB